MKHVLKQLVHSLLLTAVIVVTAAMSIATARANDAFYQNGAKNWLWVHDGTEAQFNLAIPQNDKDVTIRSTQVTDFRFATRFHPVPDAAPTPPNIAVFLAYRTNPNANALTPTIVGQLSGASILGLQSASQVPSNLQVNFFDLKNKDCQLRINRETGKLTLLVQPGECALTGQTTPLALGFQLLSPSSALAFVPSSLYSVSSRVQAATAGNTYTFEFSRTTLTPLTQAASYELGTFSGLTDTVTFVTGSGLAQTTDMQLVGSVPVTTTTAAPTTTTTAAPTTELRLISAQINQQNAFPRLDQNSTNRYGTDQVGVRRGSLTTVEMRVDNNPRTMDCESGAGPTITPASAPTTVTDGAIKSITYRFTFPITETSTGQSALKKVRCWATKTNAATAREELLEVFFSLVPLSTLENPTTAAGTTTTTAAASGTHSAAAICNFTDISTLISLERTAIIELCKRGIIQGYADGTFKPTSLINRAEFTKLLVEAFFKKEMVTDVVRRSFPDVPVDEWYSKYIATAKNENIIDGYPDGTFRPANNVTWAESAKLLVNGSRVPNLIRLYNVLSTQSSTLQWFEPFYQAIQQYTSQNFSISDWGTKAPRAKLALWLYRILTQEE